MVLFNGSGLEDAVGKYRFDVTTATGAYIHESNLSNRNGC